MLDRLAGQHSGATLRTFFTDLQEVVPFQFTQRVAWPNHRLPAHSPDGILAGHSSNKIANLLINLRTPGATRSGPPAPVALKDLAGAT